MEMYLTDKELWHVISTNKPDKSGAEQTAWIKDNQLAKAKIAESESVEDNQLIHIKHEQTSKGLWESLSKVYEQKLTLGILTLI
jgi:hypothetical protein